MGPGPNPRGAKPTLENFRPPPEKCVGHSLKILDIVQNIWAPLGKLFALLVSQAGYGSEWDMCKKFEKP